MNLISKEELICGLICAASILTPLVIWFYNIHV